MTKVKRSGKMQAMPAPGKRGAVTGLSVASGLRLQDAIAAVDPAHGLPLFVTLTYPAEWPGSWELWKKHLDNYRRALLDQFGPCLTGGIWRLEAQRRGAPHYHVLLWLQGVDSRDDLDKLRAWTTEKWYRVVGSQDIKHLLAGTQVRRVADRGEMQAVMAYLGKYLGKDSVHPESQVFENPVGRYWGVWYKARLLVPPMTVAVDRSTYLKCRRTLRTYREKKHKGRPRKGGKENANKCQEREEQAPGLRCFMAEDDARRLLDCYDPVPF